MADKDIDKVGVTFAVIDAVFVTDTKVTLKTVAYSNVDVETLLRESYKAGHIFGHGGRSIYCEFGSSDLSCKPHENKDILNRFLNVHEDKVCLIIAHITPENDNTFTMEACIAGPMGPLLKERFVNGETVLLGTRVLESAKSAVVHTIDVINSSKRLPNNFNSLTKEERIALANESFRKIEVGEVTPIEEV